MAVPYLFFAVKVYVVVALGVTIFEVFFKTEPTALSIRKVVGVPPDNFHERVDDLPLLIKFGVALKDLITGYLGAFADADISGSRIDSAGIKYPNVFATVIVTDFVIEQPAFVAVKM